MSLEKRIGHSFTNKALLRESLVHPSYQAENPEEPAHNQRLEFLGDAVLHLILAEELYNLFPDEREGVLSRNRSILARGSFLCGRALDLGLDREILIGGGEEEQGGRKRESTLEDAFESLVGAVYLDAGFEAARRLVLRCFGDLRTHLDNEETITNPKGRLQEKVQPVHGNEAIAYEITAEEGPAHNRRFHVRLLIKGKEVGTGSGVSKKEAEEKAAAAALADWTNRTKGVL